MSYCKQIDKYVRHLGNTKLKNRDIQEKHNYSNDLRRFFNLAVYPKRVW